MEEWSPNSIHQLYSKVYCGDNDALLNLEQIASIDGNNLAIAYLANALFTQHYIMNKRRAISLATSVMSWLEEQAEFDPFAQFNYGRFFNMGIGVPQDNFNAVKYYRRAAAQGHPTAISNLAFCLYAGEGMGKNTLQALVYYNQAVSLNDVAALNNIAVMYTVGNIDVPRDPVKAVEYYRRAADMGYAMAQCNLAFCYRDGNGVGQSFTDAFKYFKLSSFQKYPPAYLSLSVCYKSGEGVERNFKESYRYLQLSKNISEMTRIDRHYNLYLAYVKAFKCEYPNEYDQEDRWYRRMKALWLSSPDFMIDVNNQQQNNLLYKVSPDVAKLCILYL